MIFLRDFFGENDSLPSVSATPDKAEVMDFLSGETWKTTFSDQVLAAGRKLARAHKVSDCKAEKLDTGDMEVTARVAGFSGNPENASVVFWNEEGSVKCDSSCACPVSTNCEHAAAILEHLSRPFRLENALGEMTGGL